MWQIESATRSSDEDSSRPSSRISIVIVCLVVIATLRLGRTLVLPIVIAMLLTLTLSIPGAVLAVPLTVCVKLVCDHVPTLAHVGELLDN
jgi:predicted PurR-regulated permease PerM